MGSPRHVSQPGSRLRRLRCWTAKRLRFVGSADWQYIPAGNATVRTMGRGTGRRRRWVVVAWLYGVLAGLGAASLALAFRQGLVPPLVNPLPPIDLAEARPWLADWRLAAIKRYASVCARTLKTPQIEALQIADGPVHGGCGWSNAVRLTSAGGAHAAFDKLTCETAVALALSPLFAASAATPAAISGAAPPGTTAGASTPPPTPSISPASPWPTAAP
jgi:hypothetical protein